MQPVVAARYPGTLAILRCDPRFVARPDDQATLSLARRVADGTLSIGARPSCPPFPGLVWPGLLRRGSSPTNPSRAHDAHRPRSYPRDTASSSRPRFLSSRRFWLFSSRRTLSPFHTSSILRPAKKPAGQLYEPPQPRHTDTDSKHPRLQQPRSPTPPLHPIHPSIHPGSRPYLALTRPQRRPALSSQK
jgi:hypothetical protein